MSYNVSCQIFAVIYDLSRSGRKKCVYYLLLKMISGICPIWDIVSATISTLSVE